MYLPKLTNNKTASSPVTQFINSIKTRNFKGDVMCDYGMRIVYSTDNSIYQNLPEAILTPRNTQDVILVLQTLAEENYRDIHLCARGGGTGTNGQSLTNGIVLDTSRYMNKILKIDIEKRTVVVEPGVILSELNDQLKAYGFFFAPDVSTASRATIGGMIANDSSGKGSRIYGKTSNHIISLTQALIGGECVTTQAMTRDQTPQALLPLYDYVDKFTKKHSTLITKRFPNMDRGLTGYNLRDVSTELDGKKALNLNYIFSGAEGSLGIITQATLKITPLPKHKELLVIAYKSFDDALRQAPILLKSKVVAIETIDDKIASLAQESPEWDTVKHILAPQAAGGTFNLLEFSGDSESQVSQAIEECKQFIQKDKRHTSLYQTSNAHEMRSLWLLRSKSVGLLGRYQEKKGRLDPRPIAFMEDTAVHPDRLADYITELRAMLDKQGLSYGMFGHIDAGCLHVRPAIDMTNKKEREKIRALSDQTMKLVRKYKGVFWGEHGKGYRAEFSKKHFGATIYSALVQIKQLCDQHNQLSRGKIMVAPNQKAIQLLAIDQIPTRGEQDAQVSKKTRDSMADAFACNGNASCYNISKVNVMCPSYKATSDRRHSPKGRAMMLREWLRLLATHKSKPEDLKPHPLRMLSSPGTDDFSFQLYETMQGCLACKACTTTCPTMVNIPALKARFLAFYHSRYKRPIKDYLVAMLEIIAPYLAKAPRLANLIVQAPPTRALMSALGLVDIPRISTKTITTLGKEAYYNAHTVKAMTKVERERVVVIVQDAFTSFFDSESVISTFKILQKLGYKPLILPFHTNGKAYYVKGFLRLFARCVKRNKRWMQELYDYKITAIAIEPSMTITYRDEYEEFKAHKYSKSIMLFSEWLHGEIEHNNCAIPQTTLAQQSYRLLPHCSEITNIAQTTKYWKNIFAAFGISLEVQKTGCCGMAGTYGHEKVNLINSKMLFVRHWQDSFMDDVTCLATGFSCRGQAKRLLGVRPAYPTEILLNLIAVN